MHGSVRAFMSEIIDYAGLFPPASLALDPAIRNFASYRVSPDAWMLGKFICPAAKLKDLATYSTELFAVNPPFRFSVLGRGGETTIGFAETVRQDVASILAFCDYHRERVRIDAFEVKLPPDAVAAEDARTVDRAIRGAEEFYEIVQQDSRMVFYEVPLLGVPRKQVSEAILGVDDLSGGWGRRGLKFRCGGVEASQFPTPAELAFAIAEGAGLGTPIKFTAGLHHPFRHFNAGVNAHMHGFVNVFTAAMLVRELPRSDRERIALQVLSDERAENFVFDAEGLRWGEYRVGIHAIADVRSKIALGFGSCSFDEPREDLRVAGLL